MNCLLNLDQLAGSVPVSLFLWSMLQQAWAQRSEHQLRTAVGVQNMASAVFFQHIRCSSSSSHKNQVHGHHLACAAAYTVIRVSLFQAL